MNNQISYRAKASEIRLSVVDQSPVRKGGTARQALQESIKLAQAVEEIGFQNMSVCRVA